MRVIISLVLCLTGGVLGWAPSSSISKKSFIIPNVAANSIFSCTEPSLDQLKSQILQLGAALDRGQAYNPTSGEYYKETMVAAKDKIKGMLEEYPGKQATSLEDMSGEWELVLSTVEHGIFRSSPFFLAVQEAFEFAENKSEYIKMDLFCFECSCLVSLVMILNVLCCRCCCCCCCCCSILNNI
mmetsp:Transcript_34051/g.48378  ORF Transcript_34051/g.48378 Transcript_34051/m.48378 type:complete len:184 (+) Transcript_34051:75-626(+)